MKPEIKFVVTINFEESGKSCAFNYSARTLEVAVEVLNQFVHTYASQSSPTFREGQLHHIAMMTANEWMIQYPSDPIEELDAAEDCGFGEGNEFEDFIEIPNELFKDAVFEDGTSVLDYIERES